MALGVMGYDRNQFYDLSLGEWEMALKGCIKKNGGKLDSDYMAKSDLEDLMERYPDEPKCR